ncbi:MAG TPA: DUF2306 domain-containing protein [Tahibacter sp.]|nr:DUF2306 domain-containing protein [Tahibacter sp.]
MLVIHIAAGLASLVAGFVAIFAAKGSPLHRRAGVAFVAAMLTMTTSAFVMAAFLRPNRLNVVAALITAYFVATAFVTVKRRVADARTLIATLMAVAFATALYAFSVALRGDTTREEPAAALVVFGAFATLAAVGDARMLRAGAIDGARRLARHVWRMTLALWIATASFFLGQAKLFPAPVRASGVLAVPVLVVLALLAFWFVRTRWFGRRRAAST